MPAVETERQRGSRVMWWLNIIAKSIGFNTSPMKATLLENLPNCVRGNNSNATEQKGKQTGPQVFISHLLPDWACMSPADSCFLLSSCRKSNQTAYRTELTCKINNLEGKRKAFLVIKNCVHIVISLGQLQEGSTLGTAFCHAPWTPCTAGLGGYKCRLALHGITC
ncbi:hypothetical protein EWB00_000520 [Schistosoma japonicum]|uniref:Uncharacterized protein n=1 Tax=Schistosoma japonicum TaxID=6182 RepID=A0A4Z2CK79_SCHJA|nr:hypothetical protein EWB00_000520 [Schistosoma japonicum]